MQKKNYISYKINIELIRIKTCVCFLFFKISGQELYNALKGAASFAIKAAQEKGRILILGDQGVNRSATLTVIVCFLIFYIVIRRARLVLHVNRRRIKFHKITHQ